MRDDHFYTKGDWGIKALPIYLTVQTVLLLVTYLDFPVYAEVYRTRKFLEVTPWLGIWSLFTLLGLTTGLYLLLGKMGKSVFNEFERARLAFGWLMGVAAGLLTLGIRFMPVMPAWYFYAAGGLVLVLIAAYWGWNKLQARMNEIFP